MNMHIISSFEQKDLNNNNEYNDQEDVKASTILNSP